MKFRRVNNEWYHEFYLSEDNKIGIAINRELFNRKTVQVMLTSSDLKMSSTKFPKESLLGIRYTPSLESIIEDGDWSIIYSYPGYDREKLLYLVERIFYGLKSLPIEQKNLEYPFQLVLEYLPKKNKKYYDDDDSLQELDEIDLAAYSTKVWVF